ncbi:MutS-related protein [Roseiconus lacunae]|uniref:MutS-related protein n=1 Tax=Roseiconus lacunae TaxID=2605694 RepID=UPI001E332C0E|nr:hypothetical protein [Roseiconus lacunae]MCD0458141.1 hypothetical protein [Roseiconus lacunae]
MDAEQFYASVSERCAREFAEHAASLSRWRNARLFVVVASVGLLAIAWKLEIGSLLVAACYVTAVFCIVFFIAATEQLTMSAKDASARAMAQSQDSLARMAHDWDSFAVPESSERVNQLPLSIDLDLFGRASIFHRMCFAKSSAGRETFARWLTSPASPVEIIRRQNIAKKLVGVPQWRFDLQSKCADIERSLRQINLLQKWAEQTDHTFSATLLDWYVQALPFLAIASMLFIPFAPFVFAAMAGGIVVTNFIIIVCTSGRIYDNLMQLTRDNASTMAPSLSAVYEHVALSPEVHSLLPDFSTAAGEAQHALKRLERVVFLGTLSKNPLAAIYVYIPLQFLVLWDHQMNRMASQWRAKHGAEVSRWIAIIGEIEALSSLAAIKHENPTWAFPDVGEGLSPSFRSLELSHPLIKPSIRVSNDISIGPAGTISVITGSNMGGKSTLLRSIGVAAVLAQAGAPCCCSSLTMSPLKVLTSVKAADSLAESASLFMAQLLRLKQVIHEIRRGNEDKCELPSIYLLDEILNGTNTTDRREIVEDLIGFLLEARAIGVMTTHDMELSSESRHSNFIKSYSMGHRCGDLKTADQLKFDYKLKKGASAERSAMILASILGL